ncbi:MAG TPA: hypothetical protein VMZ53_26315 [Kofleriaceae bacterium]|nr:hypothetical protein [Kofleriaceae bacterium]
MWRVAGLVLLAACGRGFFNPDLSPDPDAATPVTAPSYVQSNYATSSMGQVTAIDAAFPLSQTAGNTIVVVVMWDSTNAALLTLFDRAGNTYRSAAGPTLTNGNWTQTSFIATDIAGGAAGTNVVEADLNASSPMRIAVLEYANVSTAQPLDGNAQAKGDSGMLPAISITTANPNELLVVAASTDYMFTDVFPTPATRVSGTNFFVQDKAAPVPATHVFATPNGTSNGNWVAQVLALQGR